jgi:maltose-binding protein MalE
MAKYQLTTNGVIDTNSGMYIPQNVINRHWVEYLKWAKTNSPDSADPAPPAATVEEIYDRAIQNQKLLKALILALNDGSFIPNSGLTNAALKNIIKAKL